MVKSMFAGVAGLRSHQSKMDVIGNNIANVNTWGFKSYSYNFMDSIYSTSVNSSAGVTTAGGMGGRNPSQVGYGSQMASISFQYTTGAPSPSDNELDCMIDGTGLFLVGGMINGGITDIKSSGLYLSRVGMFSPDNNGYIVDSQKNYVYGYALKDGTGIPEVPSVQARWEATIDIKPTETPGAGNDPATYSIEIAGVEISLTEAEFNGSVDEQVSAWLKGVKVWSQKDPAEQVDDGNGNLTNKYKPDEVKLINAAKALTDVYSISKEFVYEANKQATLGFTVKEPGVAGNNTPPPNVNNATLAEAGVDPVDAIPPEFEETLSPLQIPTDPYSGEQYNIQSWTVSELGVISGVDVENRPITIGQICLVAVENPNGLVKTSGYYFTPGDNAGDVVATAPDGGQVGSIRSKFLEMANVDLANEFSNMITTQRGFQANSKIITVTDEMLQELVNMKR